MIFLIPLAMWLCTASSYLAFFKGSPQSFRRSLLASAVLLFFYIAATTEMLSAFNLVNALAINASWVILNIALIAVSARLQKSHRTNLRTIFGDWKASFKAFYKKLGALTVFALVSLAGCTLLVALVATPNNLDSLSYHLSRLVYWVQNGNVEHYASHIERAISFSPFSEYVHLHTYLLSGGNRYFQLLQWLCLGGTLVCVSLLVELFSGTNKALRIALCFTATLPIVVLESMTTQNDLVVAFLIATTAFFVFDFTINRKYVVLFLMALTVSLGLMTKGTFVFYALPFGFYLLIFLLVRPIFWKALALAMAGIVMIVLLLNAPFWLRTYEIFESPVGTMSNGNRADIRSAGDLISSVSKHTFLHLGFVSPGNAYNHFMESQLLGLHGIIGVPLNKPGVGMVFKMNKLNFNEDFAHNFFGMWLVLFSIPMLFFARLSKEAKWYALLAFLSFVVFCSFIGYQIYGSRLHVAFFILIAPVIGLVYGSILSSVFSRILILLFWLSALPFALLSSTHPLLSTRWFFETVFPKINDTFSLNMQVGSQNLNLMQESVLFAKPEQIIWGDFLPEIEELVSYINERDPQKIGFDFTEASYDYGFQHSLQKEGRIFEHVLVRNPSRVLEKPGFQPDLILAERYEGERLNYHGQSYKVGFRTRDKWIYIPQNELK